MHNAKNKIMFGPWRKSQFVMLSVYADAAKLRKIVSKQWDKAFWGLFSFSCFTCEEKEKRTATRNAY